MIRISTRLRRLSAFSLLVVAGCGEAEPPRAAAASGSPFCAAPMARVDSFMAEYAAGRAEGERRGGTAVAAGINELVDGMNGFAQSAYGSRQFQQFVNLMTLIRAGESLEPRPWLAESWSLNEEGTELTFRLRRDVYWHDGEITDAHDVAFTYLRVTDEETAFPNGAFWDNYVRGPDGVEVVDDFTVTFRLRPHAEIMDPWRTVAIMPEHLLGQVPASELGTHPFGSVCPVGNGPFVFLSHRPQESWTFEANPTFPEALGGPPNVDRLVYRVIPDQNTLLTELLTGSVDLYMAVRADQAATVVGDGLAELRVFPSTEVTFVAWNLRQPQLADARVRRALTLATDRAAVVEGLLRGYGVVAESGVPPFHWAHDAGLQGVGHDPDEAARLLEAAGWRDRDGDGIRENAAGEPLELEVIFNAANRDRQTIAELMQAEVRAVGVSLIPVPLEAGQVQQRAFGREFGGLLLSWASDFKVDERDFFHSEVEAQPLAFSGLRDPEVDALLDTLQLFVDREDARPFWRRYQRRIIELQPFTYLFYTEKLTGLSSRLQDAEMDFRGEFQNVGDWWIRERVAR